MGDSTTIALNLTFFGTLGLAFLMFFVLFLLVVATLVLAGVGRLVALMVMALFGRLPNNDTVPLVHLPAPAASAAPEPPAHLPAVSAPADPTPDDGAAAASRTPAAAGVLKAVRAKAAASPRTPRDWGTLLKPAELGSRLRAAVGHHPMLTAARREPPVLARDWAAAVAEADARAMARARAAAPEIKISVRDLPGPAVPAERLAAVAPLVESALHQDHPVRDVPRSFEKPPAAAPLSLLDTGSLVSLSGHAKVLKGKLPADRH
ncbi:hypothetical protein QFZ30_004391 [Arthrobacter pascens]|uniref:hypothetical protein n=1 Tax=Arthrobacter pascens TaxID=1677 RepID=UPI002791A202|nr:hypothetical protein [Arthrobacter pascens]MDQ0681009.1 hypothetical protein [Arthrobacter pascens]